jgi:AcrR family transcriptional regulator
MEETSMTRREEILLATLELASERGLAAVTLSQIAERVGIRKPSLYNHFGSKDEILQAAYQFLRDQARARAGARTMDAAAPTDETLEETLLRLFVRYCSFILDAEMLRFFKVLYAERSTSPIAAQIMVEETERMVSQIRALFYSLVAHGRMRCDDVDMAALSYAMTVHGLVDLQMDRLTAGEEVGTDDPESVFAEARGYVTWFARHMEARHE